MKNKRKRREIIQKRFFGYNLHVLEQRSIFLQKEREREREGQFKTYK